MYLFSWYCYDVNSGIDIYLLIKLYIWSIHCNSVCEIILYEFMADWLIIHSLYIFIHFLYIFMHLHNNHVSLIDNTDHSTCHELDMSGPWNRWLNPLRAKISEENIFTISFIPPVLYDTGSLNPFSWKTRTYLFYIPWVLMTWRRKEPGHQQPWYCPSWTGITHCLQKTELQCVSSRVLSLLH